MAVRFSSVSLDSGWDFCMAPLTSRVPPPAVERRYDDFRIWRPARKLPTEIFLDLLEQRLIPDPFVGQNEAQVQWVGEADWLYRTQFIAPPTPLGTRYTLVFEGLDTFASVSLNQHVILNTTNMFVSHRVDVTDLLRRGGAVNELSIHFLSAWFEGKAMVKKWPEHVWGCWNGDVSRLAVRKAQYHYGWDWGPMLLTCGPWKPIHLESYTARISELSFTSEITGSTAIITVTAEVDISEQAISGQNVVFTLTAPSNDKIMTASAPISVSPPTGIYSTHQFVIEEPELWYPHGYGRQPLYKLAAKLGDINVEKMIGLREAKLIRRSLENELGTSFFFEINKIPVFAAGVNWIPADSFLTRVDFDTTRKWLEYVRDAGFVMVRVWGGGIYETDNFYSLCDTMGLLVWQDFLFGCGNYPGQIPSFQESITLEATQNIIRLRHHPSLVIFAGNNEDYSYLKDPEKPDLGYNPDDKDPNSWLKSKFPARYIYEHILLQAVQEHAPHIIYHPGSPYASPEHPSGDDLQNGDVHQWNVWHGKQLPYQDYAKISGRFVSEFGMEGYPSIHTIGSFTEQMQAFSPDLEWHNKATGGEHRIAGYLADNFKFRTDPLETYVYFTQLLQSEALSTAFRDWRRRWMGPGWELTGGALVWQINDCWPVTSWAIIDYHQRKKMAYYTIQSVLEPITINGVWREVVTPDPKQPDSEVRKSRTWNLDIWVSSLQPTLQFSSTSEPEPRNSQQEYILKVTTFSIQTGEEIAKYTHPARIRIPQNRSMDICSIPIPGLYPSSPTHSRLPTPTPTDVIPPPSYEHYDLATYITLTPPVSSSSSQATSYTTLTFPSPLKLAPFRITSLPYNLTLTYNSSTRTIIATSRLPMKALVMDAEDYDEERWVQGRDLAPWVGVKVAGGIGERWINAWVTCRWVGVEEGVRVRVL